MDIIFFDISVFDVDRSINKYFIAFMVFQLLSSFLMKRKVSWNMMDMQLEKVTHVYYYTNV